MAALMVKRYIRNTFVVRFREWSFRHPKALVAAILALTAFFALQIPGMRLASDFDDLLPRNHEHVHLHQEVADIFGGANVLTIAVETKRGTIFTNEALASISRVTEAVHKLPGVNHNLVHSLTHPNTRRIFVDEFGNVRQAPYYHQPNNASFDEAALVRLREQVLADPRVFGRLVSPDMTVAIVTAHMHTSESDVMIEVFEGVRRLQERESNSDIQIHAIGGPMLTGWVYSYFADIVQVLLYTSGLIIFLLVAYFRRPYGVLLPLAGILISSAWGLGFLNLIGITLDPLSMPIVFLLAARATSHGVQIVERYYYELARIQEGPRAARNTFDALIRPSALAITTDAVGILAIAMASAQYHLYLAAYAGFWAIAILFTVTLFVPLMLAILPAPANTTNKRQRTSEKIYALATKAARPSIAKAVLVGAAVVTAVVAVRYVPDVQFGDTEAGSPVLQTAHEYNQSAHLLAERLPGSEALYVIARADSGGALDGGMRDPQALRTMAAFDRLMLQEQKVRNSTGLPELVKQVYRLVHDGDPRWLQIPGDPVTAGGVMYAYEISSPTPGALREYTDSDFTMANLAFFVSDLRADTVQTVVGRARELAQELSGSVDGLLFDVAAGVVGVNAAINEANFRDAVVVTAFVLLAIFVAVSFNYRSLHAGLMVLSAMLFAGVVSYGYIGAAGLSVNVNIIPVIAVGIGVGIDYAIYMLDRVRSEVKNGLSLYEAVAHSLSTTGVAVLFTVATLSAGVVMWMFSALRFQAEAAVLLMVMLAVFAVGALVLLPAWLIVFRPSFIENRTVSE